MICILKTVLIRNMSKIQKKMFWPACSRFCSTWLQNTLKTSGDWNISNKTGVSLGASPRLSLTQYAHQMAVSASSA